jgi:putative cell wall-binding protein
MGKKKLFSIISIFLISVSILSNSNVNAAASNKRLWGNDRYETCSAIVQDGWKTSSDYAVIVNGQNFPDALSASTLAKKYNAPILLTQNDELNNNTYNQLRRLKVKNVFIIGGTSVVGANVEQTIKDIGIKTTRYMGQDRSETSVKVAEQIGTDNGIIITTGSDFTDALSISPISANLQMPIILVTKDTVPDSVKNFIATRNIPKVYVLGGSDIISDSVVNSLPNVQRIGGSNKYERNINIINTFENKLDFSNIYLAYSEKFADALSGSALSALNKSPIVLIGDRLDDSTRNFIKNKIQTISNINILGGNAGIPDNTISDFTNGEAPKVVDKEIVAEDFVSANNLWTYEGDSYIDTDNGYSVLTKNSNWQAGRVWLNQQISAPFTAKFKYRNGGGSGGDGLVFMFNKEKTKDLSKGGSMGFDGKGYAIEFDGSDKSWNTWDPPYAHIAIIKNAVDNHLIYTKDDSVKDNQWHDVEVNVGTNSITVKEDGKQMLTYSGEIDTEFNNIGFGGATGDLSNNHIISNVHIIKNK